MTRPRITVAQLMVIVLLVALGLAALKIAGLSARIDRINEDAARKEATLNTIIQAMHDHPGITLGLPDGYVTGVNYERQEVFVNIARRDGARPKLKLAIFESASVDVPLGSPIGMIEVARVDEQFSTARIINTNNVNKPIRVGDIIYSPAWSPNTQTRFALVGCVDTNRDGKDDRHELKRMIEEVGGVIDFDLPSADVGQMTGTLSPAIDWYVVDASSSPQSQFRTGVGGVIKEARLNGIRPMPLERLLTYLGHNTK
jgi:hypothetical protein